MKRHKTSSYQTTSRPDIQTNCFVITHYLDHDVNGENQGFEWQHASVAHSKRHPGSTRRDGKESLTPHDIIFLSITNALLFFLQSLVGGRRAGNYEEQTSKSACLKDGGGGSEKGFQSTLQLCPKVIDWHMSIIFVIVC